MPLPTTSHVERQGRADGKRFGAHVAATMATAMDWASFPGMIP